MPAALAGPGRVDHVEVVDVASGEVLLAWNLTPLRAARLARALRADLSQVQPEEFAERWLDGDNAADPTPRASGSPLRDSDSWV
jgi:hypothetical protein